ncbi:MAG: signal peptide peptidase SppA [Bacteroidales bacterium]|nr:signal peptide peptidase SppA [Bacteroidales bacterium]
MKQFFKILFASMFGAILAFILIVVIFVVIIASSTGSTTNYAEKNVLVFKNVVSVGECTTADKPSVLSQYGEQSQVGLYDVVRSLEIAAEDDKIQGIVLQDVVLDAGYTTVFELAEALKKFKEKGKFVVGYYTMLSQKSYLLSSVADEISMNSEGEAEFHGISSQSIHYKDLLEKVGLKPVVLRCGKYKSYVESVTQNKMSDENRYQKQVYIDGIWKEYESQIAKSRPILVNDLNKLADSVLVCTPDELLSYGFIDKIQHVDEFWKTVKNRMNIDEKDSLNQVSIETYVTEQNEKRVTNTVEKDKNIALVVAQGSIEYGTSNESSIGSETYMSIFKKIRKDTSIKAVVFRINSGGGSSLASELIWREVALTAEKIPVIVSMGDLAASGGYYIASPATKIVASPSTLTGSIGVFGMSMTAEGLFNKIGVNIDEVKTHKHSDFGTISRDLDPVEVAAVQKVIDKTYLTFKQRVAAGRGLTPAAVENIAQGRVWTGRDALSIGLVDTLGDLSVAFQVAKDAAFLENGAYGVKIYPNVRPWYEVLMSDVSSQTSVMEKVAKEMGLTKVLRNAPKENGVYAQLPYYFMLQ